MLKDNQEMADLLLDAEAQGLIDVFLVTVTHHAWLSVPRNQIGYPKNDRERDSVVDDCETTVNHWKHFDGSTRIGWKEEIVATDMGDHILQVTCHIV